MPLFPETSFWNKSRTRIFRLVLLIVIPALVVQIIGASYDLQQSLNERKLESVRILNYSKIDLEYLLDGARRAFSGSIRVKEMCNPDNCPQVFPLLRFAYERIAPDAINMGLADASGNIYCAINPVQGDTSIAAQPDFQAALQTLDMAVGVYRLDESTNLPIVNLSYPVLSFNGEVQTVIFATFDVRWLSNWQSEVDLPSGAAVTLIAPDGSVLLRTISSEIVPVTGLLASAASWYTASPVGTTVEEGVDLDGVTRLNTLTPLGNTADLHLGYPVRELYTKAYENLRWKLAMMIVVSIAALVLAWWSSESSFLRPLDQLLRVVKRLQGGDLTARVSALRGMSEINELGRSFNQMTDALQQREIERRQLEERFRAAFETSAIGMGLISLDGRILAANAAVTEMSGYTEEELIQRNDPQNVYPEDREVGQDLHTEMLAGKRNYYTVEKRYVRKNGEVFWTQLTLSLVHDSAGKPDYLLWLGEDIDQRKRESEARFKAMYENTAVGMSIMSLDRRIIGMNQASMRMLGYTLEELFNTNPTILSSPEDADIGADQYGDMVAGKSSGFQMEKRYIRKDGTMFWGRVTYSLVRNNAGQPDYMVGIIEDITEERNSNEKVAEAEAEYRHALEQRIAERTTELNLANERLQEKAAQDAVIAERTRLARDLHDAVTQTLFSTTLIADVLPQLWEMNQAEGQRRLEELRLLTRGALPAMRTLLVELRPNALVEVQVGFYRIAQEALNNLVKHAAADEAVLTLRMDNTVRLSVVDNGKGFDPSSVTADHLGLKIMRERAESFGANLIIYSEPDEGTQISVLWQDKLETS